MLPPTSPPRPHALFSSDSARLGTGLGRARLGIVFLTLGMLLAQAGTAPAQVAPSLDPGVILREQERLDRRERLREPPISIETEQQPAPAGATQLRFVLQELDVEGATVISLDRLRPLWAELLGQEISLANLYEIAEKIGAYYRNEGFVLTIGLVPAQEITDGRARIRIVEGFVERVRIKGDLPKFRGVIHAHARRVEASKPLRASVLERALLLINDLPGVYARAVLVPSPATPGASILELDIDQNPVNAFVGANNFGSRFNGPYRFDLGVTGNSLLGLLESTSLRMTHTPDEELHLYQGSQQHAIWTNGTRLDLSATYVETESGASLSALDVEGDSLAFSIGLSHPIIRSRAKNLSAFLRLDYLDTQSKILGTIDSEDFVRAIRLGTEFDFVDSLRGISRMNFVLTQGLPVLDHSESNDSDNSRPEASSEHTKLEASLSRLQGLPARVNLLLEVAGQFTFSDLLVSEEFTFGGRRFGRAYDVGELAGDHGLSLLAELQYGFALPTKWLESAQVYTSYDFGLVWNRESGLPRGKHDDASSWAAGIRLNATTWLALEGQLAVPLTRDALVEDSGRDPRGFFSISARWPVN